MLFLVCKKSKRYAVQRLSGIRLSTIELFERQDS